MAATLKRVADVQLVPETLKKQRSDTMSWSKQEFDAYCDLTYFAQELQNDSNALYERMEGFYSTTTFKATLPEGLSPEDKKRFYAVAKQAGLFSWKYLCTEKGSDSLFKIEQTCKAHLPELAVALIESGMPISERDLLIAVQCKQLSVVEAIYKAKPNLPVNWIKHSVGLIEQPGYEHVARGLFQRADIKDLLIELGSPYVNQLMRAGQPHHSIMSLISGRLEEVQRVSEQLPRELLHFSLTEFAARFCGEEIFRHIMQQRADLMIEIQDSNQTFPVQKTCLLKGSKYFKTMFESGFQEREKDKYVIKEEALNTLSQLLDFLHTNLITIHADNFAAIVYLGDKYEIKGLYEPLIKWLTENKAEIDKELQSKLDKLPRSPHNNPKIAGSKYGKTEMDLCKELDDGIYPTVDGIYPQWDSYYHGNYRTAQRFYLRHALRPLRTDKLKEELIDNLIFFKDIDVKGREIWFKTVAYYEDVFGDDTKYYRFNPDQLKTIQDLDFYIYGMTPLHRAAQVGSGEKIKRILKDVKSKERLALLNSANKAGHTPLALAKEDEVALSLITKGAQVNCMTPEGITLLHHAAQEGWTNTAKRILKVLPKIELKNIINQYSILDGKTPLLTTRKEAIANALMDAGANLFLGDQERFMPLHAAARNSWHAVCRAVLDKMMTSSLSLEEQRKLFFLRDNRFKWTALETSQRSNDKKTVEVREMLQAFAEYLSESEKLDQAEFEAILKKLE